MHWNGSEWASVPVPNTSGDQKELTAVAALASNDVWAVGWDREEGGVSLHWDGSEWTLVPVEVKVGHLHGLVALGSDDLWAVSSAGISHWNGERWRPVQEVRGRIQLLDIDASSADDLWAVGYRFTDFPGPETNFTAHWNGEALQTPRAPTSLNSSLVGVDVLSPNDVWAVGSDYHYGGTGYDAGLLHWDGTHWKAYRLQDNEGDQFLNGVHALSPADVWAVGFESIVHWNGLEWLPALKLDGSMRDVTADPTGSRQWAVGTVLRPGGALKTLILERCPG